MVAQVGSAAIANEQFKQESSSLPEDEDSVGSAAIANEQFKHLMNSLQTGKHCNYVGSAAIANEQFKLFLLFASLHILVYGGKRRYCE